LQIGGQFFVLVPTGAIYSEGTCDGQSGLYRPGQEAP